MELKQELALYRERFAEIAAELRSAHGAGSVHVQRAEEVSAAVQRLQWVLEAAPLVNGRDTAESRTGALV